MRRYSPIILVALLALLCAAPALAQPRGYDRPPERPRRPTHADSIRTLAGPWQVWGHAGPGWLGAPSDVRRRYAAGLELGLSGDRRLAGRLAFRAHIDYKDLPSTQPDAVLVNGIAYATNNDYGHGWLISGLGGVAVRAWNHIWLEGAGGGAHFESGFTGGTITDPLTGQRYPVPAGSGDGLLWGAGLRYEFQPTLRDRLLAEVQYLDMERDDSHLRFMAVRFGYRIF